MASTIDHALGPEPAHAFVYEFMTTTNQSRDEWWSPSDLFFLKDALERGMTCGDVAGFLSRCEGEVRNRAKQTYRRLRHYITAYDEKREAAAPKISSFLACYTCSRGPGSATCARPP